MTQSQSRLCRVCTEPESLCRCEETPALKLACKLVSEADGTHSQTVTIKHGDFLTLCERAYEWAQDASKAALSETGDTKAYPKTRGLLLSIALRMDHGLLAPINPLETVPEGFTPETWRARKIEVALQDAERAYEEITGKGFYCPERDDGYTAMEREGIAPGALFTVAKPLPHDYYADPRADE